jgi:hypothetical protein
VVAAVGDDESASPLRHQLVQARRHADTVALERQRLVEHIDAIDADNGALREAVSQLRDQLAGSLDEPSGERLDAALAREQSLRWRVAALERELEALRIRPVGELEAELAAVRARAESQAPSQTHAHSAGESHDDPPAAGGPANGTRRPQAPSARVVVDDARRLLAVRSACSGRTAALRAIEGLVRRIDRGRGRGEDRGGNMSAIDLRRELTALRRRLRG